MLSAGHERGVLCACGVRDRRKKLGAVPLKRAVGAHAQDVRNGGAAEGDGQWTPVAELGMAGERVRMRVAKGACTRAGTIPQRGDNIGEVHLW